jgi:hypothetical protein
MFTRLVLLVLLCAMFCPAILTCQQQPTASASSAVHEFPVVFQENVVAGKTPAGTKIQAKLAIATLVSGTVVPRNAVFSGEVLESVGKTKSDSSRLAIRFDSAQWKSVTAKTRLYVTTWIYPRVSEAAPELQYGPPQSDKKTWNGMGEYPSSDPTYRPFPKSTDDKGSSAPETSASVTSDHRIRMKDVESENDKEGVITLVSSHSNIRLDKATMYVLSSSDLASSPRK